jgi:hypothetical protein
MSNGRARRTSLSISLFPFLAVLICTLGVLIVLLVLAVKAAEVQASEDHESHQERLEQQKTALTRFQDQIDETELRIELISKSRPQSLDRLNQSREYRSHLESEIRSLKAKIADLDSSLARVEEAAPANENVEESNQRIEELTRNILLAEKELEEKRKANTTNAKVTYSIVPHEGAGGTFRRPIFIVCETDSITIEPLGIRLDKNDFVPPLGPGNPLDAAVLAIREYWLKHDLNGKDGSPYPLIVIRPDGAEGYAISRRAMTSWEDEFGYELVEAGKELDFGEADPQLKSLVEAAVAEAKLRQRNMLAARSMKNPLLAPANGMRPGRGASGRGLEHRPGLTASGANGGFVVNSAWEELDQHGYGAKDGSAITNGSSDTDRRNPTFGHPVSFEARLNQRQDSKLMTTLPNFQEKGTQGSVISPSTSGASFDESAFSNDHRQAVGAISGGNSATGSHERNSTDKSNERSANTVSGSSGAQGSGQTAGNENSAPSLMYQHTNLAQARGKDWAIPNKPVGATAYVRPIRVVCTANEIEVRSPLGVEKRIPIGNDITGTIDPLINEIWKQIESWGMPGENSYWKPELRIGVAAGGELNFEQLRGLLFGSGIQIKESPK